MLSPSTGCHAVVLNQQQQQNADYHSHCDRLLERVTVNCAKNKAKYCTVVENGRVVVRRAEINE